MKNLILSAMKQNDTRTLQEHFDEVKSFSQENYLVFRAIFEKAEREASGEITDILSPLIDPKLIGVGTGKNTDYWTALSEACAMEKYDDLETLLELSDPSAQQSMALNEVSGRGRLDLVQKLLPLSNVQENNGEALAWAAGYNHIDVVKFLVRYMNPKSQDSKALWASSVNGHKEMFDFLYPLSNPKDVLKKLDAENALPDERLLLDERMMSEKIIKSNKRNIKNHIRLQSQKKKINPSQNKRKI